MDKVLAFDNRLFLGSSFVLGDMMSALGDEKIPPILDALYTYTVPTKIDFVNEGRMHVKSVVVKSAESYV